MKRGLSGVKSVFPLPLLGRFGGEEEGLERGMGCTFGSLKSGCESVEGCMEECSCLMQTSFVGIGVEAEA